MRCALLHMLADAAGSVGATAAGVAVTLFDADWVDPAASVLSAPLVVYTSWGLLADTTHVLIEDAPATSTNASNPHSRPPTGSCRSTTCPCGSSRRKPPLCQRT